MAGCARDNHMREISRIPVRKPNASIRLAMSHVAWVGRSMNSIVRFRKPHPYDPHWVVWSRRQLLRCLFRIHIPIMHWIPIKPWIASYNENLPIANRQRVMGITHGGWVLRQHFVANAYAVTVRFDLDTTTRNARRAGARVTFATKICSPAVSSFLPGFKSASSFGDM